jgi:DNA-directed RNA polymerase specialized sigma subunit
MKKYNVKNYIRYKEDVKVSIANIKQKRFVDYTPEELKIIFLPLVENISRKFATSQEASGVMSINDIIQEGSLQLCKAVDKIDRTRLFESEDIEKTLKSFLAKRIRGGIRRAIDINRGTMRIPEHKLNEMRKSKDEKMVAMFFNSIFLSIDANQNDENMVYQIPDKSDPYNEVLLNSYIISLLNKHLTSDEALVLNKSYGLDGKKWSANDIAAALEIKGVSAYVRVSELKKQAVQKLIDNVDHSQVLDYL